MEEYKLDPIFTEPKKYTYSKNFLGFKNPVGTQESYEYVMSQRVLLGATKANGVSKGLKPQRYYDTRDRLREKLLAKSKE